MGMDVFGLSPANEAGEYFRASVWSWRPIHCLIREANERHHLAFDLTGFDSNSGHGLGTQSDCDKLASALELLLKETDASDFTLDEEPTGPEGAVLKMLAQSGWTLSTMPGTATHVAVCAPSYSTDREHVLEFVNFLKYCGGFRIC